MEGWDGPTGGGQLPGSGLFRLKDDVRRDWDSRGGTGRRQAQVPVLSPQRSRLWMLMRCSLLYIWVSPGCVGRALTALLQLLFFFLRRGRNKNT